MGKVEIAGVNTSDIPKLTNAEQLVMLNQIKAGNKEVRAKFIYANMRLVLSVIQKYIHKKGNYDDMFQVGCIGLIKAIDNFDARFNVQFSTYAVPMILGEVRRYLRDTNSLRVSRSLRDIAYKSLQAKEHLTQVLEREPTIDEIANFLEVPYRQVYFAFNATSNMVSLDDVLFSESSKDVPVIERISTNYSESDKWVEDVMLSRAIESLAEREREILVMRYFYGKTQVEVSNDVGISQAQVSRLEKNALDGLKKKL